MSTVGDNAINKITKLDLSENEQAIKDACVKVRAQFLQQYEANRELYDECDIERVKTIEFTVKRFVLYNDLDLDKAVKQLDETMKWRKSSGVNVKTEKDAPIEFYRAGAVFQLGADRNGLPVVYFRAKTVIKISKLKPIMHLMAINIINRIDSNCECTGNGFVCVMDLLGVGLKNADLDLIQFVINVLRKYFPLALSRLIVLNVPWYLKGLVAVIRMWLSAEEQVLLKFASGAELFKYIDKEQVPKYLGGKNDTDFTIAPDGCQPCIEMCESYGITKAEANEYMHRYAYIIDEGQKLVQNPDYNNLKTNQLFETEDDFNNNNLDKDNLLNLYEN